MKPKSTTLPSVSAADASCDRARPYSSSELFAIAEMGHAYVFSGAIQVALVLFEGLCEVSPREPYFAIAMGLCLDRLGRIADAVDAYAKAASLDATDARPHVNIAELAFLMGDEARARRHLQDARMLLATTVDSALAKKVDALMTTLHRRSKPFRD